LNAIAAGYDILLMSLLIPEVDKDEGLEGRKEGGKRKGRKEEKRTLLCTV